MQVNTERLLLRVLELEDAVRLLTTVAQKLNEMVADLNEVGQIHTRLLSGVLGGAGEDQTLTADPAAVGGGDHA